MRTKKEPSTVALAYVEAIERHELTYCRGIAGDNRLTSDEYDRATQAFKDLIDTPWKKGEPIYIVPEKDENGDLNPQLQHLMKEIQRGTFYHQFIKVGSGTLWPLVLRLYYGLKDGFSISIEQMCAMLQVGYCHDAHLETEYVPFFEGNSLRINRMGSQLIQRLIPIEDRTNTTVVHDIITTIIEPFRLALAQASNAEKCIQKITLDKKYFKTTEDGRIAFQTPPQLVKRLKESGLELLYLIVNSQNGFTSVYQENDKVFLLLPSFTMLKLSHQVVNPDRVVTYTPRLGIITPQTLEDGSNLNQRMGSLYAPGITNPKVAHGTVVLPISMCVHDLYYHFFLDAMLSSDTHSQLLYIVSLLRASSQESTVMTSELRRCTDRELLITSHRFQRNQNESFPDVIKRIFSISSSEKISPSFVIILVDAILNSRQLPYISQLLENRYYKRLLQWDNLPTLLEFKDKVECYNREIKGHSSKIAILILCRFYLNDIAFCQALVENMKHNMAGITVTWEKNSDKHFHPVFTRNTRTRSLNDLKNLSSIQRVQELSPLLYPMPEYDQQDHEALTRIIEHQKGEIIVNQSKITHFFMASSLLQAPVRQELKLDRVKGNNINEKQIAYLKRKIPEIVIETIIEDQTKASTAVSTLFTFPAARRDQVKSVLTEWEQLKNKEAIKIQGLYRLYAIRKMRLFDNVTPKPDQLEIVNSESTRLTVSS